jgi:hypothetical protein
MDTDHAEADDLAVVREVLGVDDGGKSALGWEEVRAFETQHGIVLPEPYRTYVAEVSDGSYQGPPAYGLLSLSELPSYWGDDRPVRKLSQPFPLTEAWMWEEDPRDEDELEPLLDPVFDHGSIVLGTDGCGMYWHLIVTGQHRGHIWWISGEGAMPFGAEFGYTTGEPGFAGWVRHWAADKPWFDVD